MSHGNSAQSGVVLLVLGNALCCSIGSADAQIKMVAQVAPALQEAPMTLEPLNRTQFFLRPNENETLKWKVQGTATKVSCEVRDYHDAVVASHELEVKGGEVQLPLRLAAGFYELRFQPGGQRYGVVALAPHQGAVDKFFAIDAALSWLETRTEMRADLVALLKRSGIGLVRERLSWGAVNPKEGQWDWETNRNFDALRQEYTRNGVQILELFHGAPEWTKLNSASTYPEQLGKTKASWQAMGKQWKNVWNALEVWNEPDISFGGEEPADQYLPLVKTINYGLSESGSSALVGGGVFAYFNPNYIQGAVKNGLLDQVDFVSFHTYAKAPSMEQIIGDYRRALMVKGQPVVPLWLTESGQPWKSGQERPTIAEDSTSALDITMKAVEARACGIASYFAFVYPFYVEGAHNFGMMGQEVSPLRSMAAYTQVIAELSNSQYVGDLDLKTTAVQRARVFAKGDDAVVVLYAENAKMGSSVAWTGDVTSLRGIDGRQLKRLANGGIPVDDGLTYVHASLKSLAGLSRQTIAAQLSATAKSARTKRPAASAIVLQPVLPKSVLATKQGYKVAPGDLATFPFKVRVNNLASTAKQVTVQCTLNDGTALPARSLQLAAEATEEVQWDVDLVQTLQKTGAETVDVEVTGKEQGSAIGSSLALTLLCERDLEAYLKNYSSSTKLEITDLTRWKRNITPIGEMKMSVVDGKNWQLFSTYKPGDRWVYPELQMPANLDFKGSQGIIVRARAMASAVVRLMVKERNGSTYFTPFSLMPADGGWHAVLLKWGDLAALPSAPPDPNGQLDLDEIVSISVGMNSKTDENTLEVSDLYVARNP
ncbi:hypothetical protein EON83_23210 [bacterium]|nr:MAG: hypothetical protein EON83_23210 [bacterium]